MYTDIFDPNWLALRHTTHLIGRSIGLPIPTGILLCLSEDIFGNHLNFNLTWLEIVTHATPSIIVLRSRLMRKHPLTWEWIRSIRLKDQPCSLVDIVDTLTLCLVRSSTYLEIRRKLICRVLVCRRPVLTHHWPRYFQPDMHNRYSIRNAPFWHDKDFLFLPHPWCTSIIPSLYVGSISTGKYLLHHHPICTVQTFKNGRLVINLVYESVCLILHAVADHPGSAWVPSIQSICHVPGAKCMIQYHTISSYGHRHGALWHKRDLVSLE
jgi:hypothetical protein